MSLRDRFVEIWNDYKYDDTVEGMIDALLTAVCEERGHLLPTGVAGEYGFGLKYSGPCIDCGYDASLPD